MTRTTMELVTLLAGTSISNAQQSVRSRDAKPTFVEQAIEPDGAGFVGHPQGAPADQPGAEEWRGRDGGQARVERDGEGRLGHEVAREAAVARAAGEAGRVAKVLPVGPAVGAMPAGMPEPGHADSGARPRLLHTFADRLDYADDLMAGHDGVDGLG